MPKNLHDHDLPITVTLGLNLVYISAVIFLIYDHSETEVHPDIVRVHTMHYIGIVMSQNV